MTSTIKDPKVLLAHLNAGAEIVQVGWDRNFVSLGDPDYTLRRNGQPDFKPLPEHVRALETLKIITVDYCTGGARWVSKADFSFPDIGI